jgi:hypothetical protein
MKNNQYDVCVAYRIYPRVSKVPFIHQDNKFKLAQVGVETFKASLGTLQAKVFFILDNCPSEYETMILEYFNKEDVEFVRCNAEGNLATFGRQLDILLAQSFSEVVYFAEDDYVYRKNVMNNAISLLNNRSAHFVTLYDHLDSYTLDIHTMHRYRILLHENVHWRTSASTCLTFLTTKETLRKTEKMLRSYCYGNWDSSLWFALTKFNVFDFSFAFKMLIKDRFYFKMFLLSWIKGWSQIVFGKKYILVQPIPSMATHMEKVAIAPGVDWQKIVNAIDV